MATPEHWIHIYTRFEFKLNTLHQDSLEGLGGQEEDIGYKILSGREKNQYVQEGLILGGDD